MNAKCRMQNAKFRGEADYKLQVESGKLQVEGLKPIVDKAVVTRSLTSLRKERGGPSLAMVESPVKLIYKSIYWQRWWVVR